MSALADLANLKREEQIASTKPTTSTELLSRLHGAVG